MKAKEEVYIKIVSTPHKNPELAFKAMMKKVQDLGLEIRRRQERILIYQTDGGWQSEVTLITHYEAESEW